MGDVGDFTELHALTVMPHRATPTSGCDTPSGRASRARLKQAVAAMSSEKFARRRDGELHQRALADDIASAFPVVGRTFGITQDDEHC